MFVFYLQASPTTVFTDVMSLFTNLGITDYVTGAIMAMVVLGVSGALLRFIR